MPEIWKKATIILTATAALAVAGGAGAVAGDLIGTKDIKDNAITSAKLGEGSVRWGKHLNADTKERIKSFAGADGVDGAAGLDGVAGATGAVGPAGIRGATGPAGSRGASGVDGDGTLVGYNLYQVEADPDTPVTEMDGLLEDVAIAEPGIYLVLLHGVLVGPGSLYADIEGRFDDLVFVRACRPTEPIDPSADVEIAVCSTSYTISVTEEDLAEGDLLVQVLSLDFFTDQGTPAAIAELSLIALGGELPEGNCRQCRPRAGESLDGLFRKMRRQLAAR